MKQPMIGAVTAALAAVLALGAGAALHAQSAVDLPAARSPGFGGGGFFLSPHAAAGFGRFRAAGELELGWGESATREGTAALSARLPAALRLSAAWTGLAATAGLERRSDRTVGLTLEHARGALTVGRRASRAGADGYSSELNGLDVRVAVDLGTPLDIDLAVTRRSASVIERGDTEIHQPITVAGYEFVSVRRLQYFAASRHQDFELELSAAVGPLRVGGLIGRGFSDGEAPDRSWAYGRVALPVARRLDILAEAGRNGGVPAIGRLPQNFARMGMRLDLGSDTGEPVPAHVPAPAAAAAALIDVAAAEPRLIIAARAASIIELKGDFTAWETRPLTRLPDGRWFVAVRRGVLHFNIRIDGGEWTVPAGVPTVPDEFSGAPVAVVVVGDR